MLIACPARVMSVWARETARWTNLKPIRLDQSIAERNRILENFITVNMHRGVVFIVNYEALARMKDTILACMQRAKIGLNLDEAHKVKNPQAQVTKAALAIARKAPWRGALTGTPVTNTGQDLWSQMYVVDMGVTFGASFRAYRDEFFDVNPWSHQSSLLPGAEDEINKRLQRRALRYRQIDCFDMPEKIYATIPIPLTEAQQSAYQQMEDDLVSVIEGDKWETDDDGNPIEDLKDDATSRAMIILTKYLRLAQITSGFLPLDNGTVHQFDPNPKLDILENEVRQLVEDGQSALIWAWYQVDVANIRRRLHDLNPVVIVGGMDSPPRRGSGSRLPERRDESADWQSGQRRARLEADRCDDSLLLLAELQYGVPRTERGAKLRTGARRQACPQLCRPVRPS
jgi:SNF2 family DNA or RNA helicase